MKINDLNIAFTVLFSLFLAIDSYSQVLPSYHAVHHKKKIQVSQIMQPKVVKKF